MDFQAYDIALVPVIVALVYAIRNAGFPARYLPLLALVFGVAAGFLYLSPDDPKQAALVGIVVGLAAIGAWSGTKNTLQRSN